MKTLLTLLFFFITANLQAGYVFETLSAPGFQVTILEGINDRGDVVGAAGQFDDYEYKSFLLSQGKYTFFEAPFGPNTAAFGINNSQAVVGSYLGSKGFLREKGRRRSIVYSEVVLPFEGTWQTRPSAINNLGWIVGEFVDHPNGGGHQQHGFVNVEDEFTPIHVPDSCCTSATGINDSGQIVGFYHQSEGSITRGFVTHSGDEYDVIEYPGSTSTIPLGINGKGQVVGIAVIYEIHNGEIMSAEIISWIYNKGVFTPIDVPNALETVVSGINRQGWITGYYVPRGGGIYGFIGRPGRRSIRQR